MPVTNTGKEVGRVSIRVLPNATKFREDVRQMLKRVEGSMAANIKVEADTRPAENAVRKLRDDIKKRAADLKVDAKTLAASAQIAKTARDRRVKLAVDVSKASVARAATILASLSGARLVSSTFADIGRGLSNIDKNLPKIALVATSVGSLVSLILSGIGGIATVGSSVASLVALAAPVPGLLAAAGVAGITLAVALSAAKEQLSELQPVWTSLKATIQDNFWARARQPILDLVNGVFPQLSDGLAAASNSLGAWAASIATSFQAAFGGDVLANMLGLLSTGIDNSTVGMDAFASSIATLGTFASQYLPSIGTWFSDISIQFNNWITTVAGNGQLDSWVTSAMTAITQLGSIVGSTIEIFGGIDQAAMAAGGGGLATFESVMSTIAGIVNGPAFQTALTTIFEGANAGASALSASLVPIGNAIATLAPTISSVLTIAGQALGGLLTSIAAALQEPAFADGLEMFFAGIKTGLAAIGPALPAVAAALGTLGAVVGDLAATLGPVLGAALSAAAPLFSDLLANIAPLIPVLGDALIQSIESLAPALLSIADEVIPPLVEAIIELTPLLPSLISFFAQMLTTVAPIAGQLLETLLPAFVTLTPAIVQMLEALTPLLQFLPILSQGVQLLAAVISTVLVAAFGIAQVIWTTFTALITGDWSNFSQNIIGITRGMGDSISGIWQGFTDTVSSIFSDSVEKVTQIGRDLGSGLRDLFSGAGSWLVDSGRSIVEGLARGIRGAVGAATDAIGSVLSAVRDFLPFSPARVGPFSGRGWSLYSGQAIGLALASGMRSTTSTVQAAANELAASAYIGGTGAATTSTAANGAAAVSFPDEIMLVDQDGSILTRARVIADDVVASYDNETVRQVKGGVNRYG
ncbi:hypothetical protein [Herbiconiux sp. UC225_62]|uniref:phage tail protein n=1 Tax=Herbiconiux sp. UC225_62 TaxID=3350168 RepID=UPI0036D21A4D